MKYKTIYLSLAVVILLLINGCSFLTKSDRATVSLTISAASSLQNALKELESVCERDNRAVDIVYNFAASGSLQRQIQQGAQIDIFISAAASYMDILEEEGLLLAKTRQNLLENRLALIVPKSEGKTAIDSFADLKSLEFDTIALGEPKNVPVGKYALEVLTNLDIGDRVLDRSVYGKDVRQVLNYVATGNVDAGIVYYTDTIESDRIALVAIAPQATHSPIVYPIAVLKDSSNKEIATELVECFLSPQAQTTFQKYGFQTVTLKN